MRRAPGQTLVNLPMKVVFKDFLDGVLPKLCYGDRSKFIRDALREKLLAMGEPVPIEYTMPPGRAGKGGRRRTIYPELKPSALMMNEDPNFGSRAKTTGSSGSVAAAAVRAVKRASRPKPGQ